MKKNIIKFAVVALAIFSLGSEVRAQTPVKRVRAVELTSQLWSDFNKGEIQELVVEFRHGDRLPITLAAEGDLLETAELNPSYVTVKRNFWIKIEQNQMYLSLDGSIFKHFKDSLTGSFTAGASSDDRNSAANAINLVFKAVLK